MLALAPVPAVFLHRHKRVIMIEELRVIFPRSCSTTTATDAQHGDTTVGICIKPGELSPVNTAVSSVTSHRNIFNIQKLWKMHFVAGWVCDFFFFFEGRYSGERSCPFERGALERMCLRDDRR